MSNSNYPIKVENLSKLYRLGQVSTGTLSHDLNRWFHKIRGKEDPFAKIAQVNDRSVKSDSDYAWALKDINFEVQQGDVLGIIGKNGAGKSTLLKLLSKITTPTTGKITVEGRIASLLEVGTGFHPEMTGRENVFMNGAILGMRQWEIQKKFDQIVDFSGVEKYIDTPVKRYSSGMYVRLAFAVAAHLEPEILIVDEVLAVGDADFQKKCLGRMKDASEKEGRTVLFVSHNMAAVQSLCNRGLVLENGTVKLVSDATTAVSYYLKGNSETKNKKVFGAAYQFPAFALTEISLANVGKTTDDVLLENEEIALTTSFVNKGGLNNNDSLSHVTYHLYNEMGEAMFSFASARDGVKLQHGNNDLTCFFPKNFFQSGTYYLSIFVISHKPECLFTEKDIMSFTVVDGGRLLGKFMGREPGSIRPNFRWENNLSE